MNARTGLLLTTAASFALMHQPAAAQSEASARRMPDAVEVEEAPIVAVDEIIVTARKREERLIEAPQSITALSGEDLAEIGATQFRDFANLVPALSYTTAGPGQTQISLRGVTAGIDIGPTVGIYVDDVPFGSSAAFSNSSSLALDVGLFDLDRIEVLRGPQGTLYGASTMGGLIKYVTRRPSPSKFGLVGQAGISGTRNGGLGYNAAAAVNVPIAPDVAGLRATGFYARDGGYIDNVALGDDDVNAADIYGGRADLLLRPSPPLTVRLTGFLQNVRRGGTAAADFTFDGEPVDGKLDQRRLVTEPFDQDFRLVSGTVDYDFGPATLTSISSFQTVEIDFRQDASAAYVPLLAMFGLDFSKVGVVQGRTTDKFTQEVRLTSNGFGAIDWLIGGFYTDEKSGNTQQTEQFDAAGAPSPINLATVSIPSSYEEQALFGNATYHLTDRLDLSAGARFAKNSQSFEQIGSGLLVGGSVPETRTSDEVVTWLANASYEFSPNAFGYLRYATGYRPGGPNFVVSDPVTGEPLADATFQSDSLKSYEAGYRFQTANRVFGLDLAAYHIDWDDIQVSTAAGGVSVIANAGRAKIDGGELVLTARPTAGLTATGSFAYQNARLAEDSPELGASEGERLPNVPRFTAALNADWEGSGQLEPRLGATLRHTGKRNASFDANPGFPQYELPAYTAVDLRGGISLHEFDLTAYVRNLFDVRGQLSAQTVLSTAGGPAQVTILQPRTVGLTATTRF